MYLLGVNRCALWKGTIPVTAFVLFWVSSWCATVVYGHVLANSLPDTMHLVNSAGALVQYLLSRFVLPMTVLSLTETPALNMLGTTPPALSTILLIPPKLALPPSLLLFLLPPLAIRWSRWVCPRLKLMVQDMQELIKLHLLSVALDSK